MDILDYAMQMEIDGKAFYEKSAGSVAQPELKKILLQLAQEEDNHYRFFKSLKDGQLATAQKHSESYGATILAKKNLFQELTEQQAHESFGSEARAIWNHALKIEEQAEKKYRDEASRQTDPQRKTLLERIADEEKSHVYLIDNIISFMADPKGFVDSANYRNFMSWEGR